MERQASLSPCGTYRYKLTRRWSDERALAFVMLNPSTADHQQDDPTIRKCIGFAQRHRYGGVHVVNLFALRSTQPAGLLLHADPVGPYNDEYLSALHPEHTVVLAWGAPSSARIRQLVAIRAQTVLAVLRGRPLFCLGRALGGAPRHPLMLAYATPLEAFTPQSSGSAGVRAPRV